MQRLNCLSSAFLLSLALGCEPKAPPEPPPIASQSQPVAPETFGFTIPDGGAPLFSTDESKPQLRKGPDDAMAAYEDVSGEGTGFAKAIRCRVLGELPEEPWFTQVTTVCPTALKQGDTVLLTVWARSIASKAEDGRGDFLLYFGIPAKDDTPTEQNVPATYAQRVKVDKEWQQILVPRTVPADYPAGAAMLNLDFGYVVQTIEFAGIQVYHYSDKQIRDLPSTE